MSKLEEQKEVVKLEKKLRNQPGGADYIDGLRAKSLNDLEFEIKQLAVHKQAVITTQKKDEELERAKAVVKELNAPYREQLADNNDKSRFIGLLLQEIQGE